MKEELINEVNGCDLDFYINLDASGMQNEECELSCDEFDHVNYRIRDGKLLSWFGEEILDLKDLDDSRWEYMMHPDDEDDCKPMTWFECFVYEIMNHVIENGLIGDEEFENLIDDRRILLVLLKNDQDDIIEEIDEWDIHENVS